MTWILLILSALCKPTNFAFTRYHRVTMIQHCYSSVVVVSTTEGVSDVWFCSSPPTHRAQCFLWKPHTHAGSVTTTVPHFFAPQASAGLLVLWNLINSLPSGQYFWHQFTAVTLASQNVFLHLNPSLLEAIEGQFSHLPAFQKHSNINSTQKHIREATAFHI